MPMVLQPSHVSIMLFCTVCLTTTLYFFAPPKSIARGKASKSGPWGLPTAEFDWCEVNYEFLDMIAEPLNVATSLVYVGLIGVGACVNDYENVSGALLLFLISLVGIGSVTFHTSLQYPAQLADELPMYWLICCASALFYTRGNDNPPLKSKNMVYIFAFLWCVLITVFLLMTERDSQIHTLVRGILSCSFSVQIVTVFYMACHCGHEVDQMLLKYESTGNHIVILQVFVSGSRLAVSYILKGSDILWSRFILSVINMGSDLFAVGFWSFLVSVIAWVLDILFCDLLQSFPVYINLHAMWHLMSAYGVYCLITLLSVHCFFNEGLKVRIAWKWFGVVPAIISR